MNDRDELQAEAERDMLIHLIASELDRPSVFMGGPSSSNLRRAEGLVARWEEAVASASPYLPQPAPKEDPK